MAELYSAILNPSGPNYGFWSRLFDCTRVPLQSAKSIRAELGPEKDVEVYLLDLKALPLKQRAFLLAALAEKFGVPIYEVDREIAKHGFPIRAADVIVAFDMRAFV